MLLDWILAELQYKNKQLFWGLCKKKIVVTWLSNRFSATVHLDPFKSNWPTGLTKLNCTVAVSPRTSTLHSSAISVYICVFPFLPPSTRLRFVCVPFCPRPPSSSSSSLPPSSLFFPSSTSTSWKKKNPFLPSWLTHPFCTLANPKLFSHYISAQSAAVLLSIETHRTCQFSFALSIWSVLSLWYRAIGKLLNRWVFFKTLKVNRAPCLIFVGTVCYVVCYFCACAVWVRLQFASVTEAGCHVLSDTAHMSCAGLMSINLCPASFLLQSTAVQVRGPGGRKKETSVDTHDTINQ